MATACLVGVSKRFGRRVAVDTVSLAVAGGEVVGLVGPNGAGKTTTLRMLAGLVRPTAGRVERDGPVRYFGGERTLPPDASARRWMAACAPRLAAHTAARRFGELSRGTRQRLGLEAALDVSEPAVILLDEPWEGLDPDATRWLSDAIVECRASGHAVLVSSHRIHDLAPVCDRCEAMVGGHIAADVVCAGLAPDERVAALFDVFARARR